MQSEEGQTWRMGSSNCCSSSRSSTRKSRALGWKIRSTPCKLPVTIFAASPHAPVVKRQRRMHQTLTLFCLTSGTLLLPASVHNVLPPAYIAADASDPARADCPSRLHVDHDCCRPDRRREVATALWPGPSRAAMMTMFPASTVPLWPLRAGKPRPGSHVRVLGGSAPSPLGWLSMLATAMQPRSNSSSSPQVTRHHSRALNNDTATRHPRPKRALVSTQQLLRHLVSSRLP
jgi:hypothetical protein